jgi:hypothetical protein
MRSRPILFSAEMVKAILDGRKTQTRRIVKLTDSGRVKAPGSSLNWHLDDPNATLACPYGQPGDQLWVKETWRTTHHYDNQSPRQLMAVPIRYECDGAEKDFIDWWDSDQPGKVRQSIYMRKWMSRISLEITGIRIQRLQKINEKDAWAEGVWPNPKPQTPISGIIRFESLWCSIHGRQSWDANPFVWAITFRRIP